MGKRSVKENKNIWQESRENKNLSREAASELLRYVSADRIEKIESGRSAPHPDEVLLMEQGYGNAECAKDKRIYTGRPGEPPVCHQADHLEVGERALRTGRRQTGAALGSAGDPGGGAAGYND